MIDNELQWITVNYNELLEWLTIIYNDLPR